MTHRQYRYVAHARGYANGDLRCSVCLKWLNPDEPEEATEIRYSGSYRRRYHYKQYCTKEKALQPAILVSRARGRGIKRTTEFEKRLKRY